MFCWKWKQIVHFASLGDWCTLDPGAILWLLGCTFSVLMTRRMVVAIETCYGRCQLPWMRKEALRYTNHRVTERVSFVLLWPMWHHKAYKCILASQVIGDHLSWRVILSIWMCHNQEEIHTSIATRLLLLTQIIHVMFSYRSGLSSICSKVAPLWRL